jgi:hypothetical protein
MEASAQDSCVTAMQKSRENQQLSSISTAANLMNHCACFWTLSVEMRIRDRLAGRGYRRLDPERRQPFEEPRLRHARREAIMGVEGGIFPRRFHRLKRSAGSQSRPNKLAGLSTRILCRGRNILIGASPSAGRASFVAQKRA